MVNFHKFNYSKEHFNLIKSIDDIAQSDPWKKWRSPKMMSHFMSIMPDKANYQVELIEKDDQIIGYGETYVDPWAYDEDRLDATIILPFSQDYYEVGKLALERQLHLAKQSGKTKVRGWQHECRTWAKPLYLELGFTETLVEYFSQIDLTKFYAKNHNDTLDKFNNTGYEILSLPELQSKEQDWEHKLFELWKGIEQDVPTDIELNIDFDIWKREVLSEWSLLNHFYIATDKNVWMALTSYERSDIDHQRAGTNLTGVLPNYRRKSVCTALKVHALNKLKEAGYQATFTGNEENNPMFQINLMLGFKKVGESFGCQLEI